MADARNANKILLGKSGGKALLGRHSLLGGKLTLKRSLFVPTDRTLDRGLDASDSG
jgi:hypothetical protein